MKCVFPYRIYPAWFDGGDVAAMRELAMHTAKDMGCVASDITVVGTGFDHKHGHYRDFDVTYIEAATQRSTSI